MDYKTMKIADHQYEDFKKAKKCWICKIAGFVMHLKEIKLNIIITLLVNIILHFVLVCSGESLVTFK